MWKKFHLLVKGRSALTMVYAVSSRNFAHLIEGWAVYRTFFVCSIEVLSATSHEQVQ